MFASLMPCPTSKERKAPCPYDLSKVALKTLLKWRNKCYACGGKYDPYNAGDGPMIYLDEIKEELAKRPHLPNKQERRVARQEAAKAKRNK